MRIGVSSPIVEPRPTGVGIYSLNLVNELAKWCDELLVYTSYPPAFQIPLTNVRTVSSLTRPEHGLAGFLSRIMWMQSSLPLRAILDRVSVILSTGSEGMLLPPVPQVVTVHDLIPLLLSSLHPHTSELFFFRHFLPLVLQRSRAIIAVSKSTKEDIIKFYHLPAEKIHVIYEGYDAKLFYPRQDIEIVTRVYGLEHYILYVGNLLPHKNVASLIRAFHLISSKVPHRLVLEGRRDTAHAAELETLVRELGLEGRVVFLGYVPLNHLPYLYSGATVFVTVSLSEGFGLPPLEAIACGTPVVASRVSSLPEVVGDAGILVEPNDIEQIAQVLLRMIEDSALRAEFSRKALKRAAVFSWSMTARQTFEVLQSVVKSKQPRPQ